MHQLSLSKEKSISCLRLVFALCILSIVSIISCAYLISDGDFQAFHFSDRRIDWLRVLMNLVPGGLLAAYILLSKYQNNLWWLFGLLLTYITLLLVHSLVDKVRIVTSGEYKLIYFSDNMLEASFDLLKEVSLSVIAFALATVCFLTAFKSKLFLLIAASVGIFAELLLHFDDLQVIPFYLERGYMIEIIYMILDTLYWIPLYIALILLVVNNKIPVIPLKFFPNKEKKILAMPAQDALLTLNAEYEAGKLSEAEYQNLREAVISQL